VPLVVAEFESWYTGVRVLRQGRAGRGAGGGGVPRDGGVQHGALARRPGPVVVQGAAARPGLGSGARTPPTRTPWARNATLGTVEHVSGASLTR
jgi:hypothetical protein